MIVLLEGIGGYAGPHEDSEYLRLAQVDLLS